jgi:hypothetical protein
MVTKIDIDSMHIILINCFALPILFVKEIDTIN